MDEHKEEAIEKKWPLWATALLVLAVDAALVAIGYGIYRLFKG